MAEQSSYVHYTDETLKQMIAERLAKLPAGHPGWSAAVLITALDTRAGKRFAMLAWLIEFRPEDK